MSRTLQVLTLRIPPKLYAAVKRLAKKEVTSMNQYAAETLIRRVEAEEKAEVAQP
jgi:predicted HicB family RNase H-like nuclease